MTRSREVNERSPLRLFERSIHGGLGRGNIGVVCSGPGVGKTAFLVGVALDYLMRGEQVLHVGLDQPVERIRNYYDEIFAELARLEDLEDAAEVGLKIERNRRIHTYQEHSFNVGSLERTLSFFRNHTDIDPAIMVLDGYDWRGDVERDLAALKRIAREQEAELWMSARSPRTATGPGVPDPVAPYEAHLDVVVRLRTAGGAIRLELLKEHDSPEPGSTAVDLDPTTLLLVRR